MNKLYVPLNFWRREILLLLVLIAGVTRVSAATFTVTNTNDNGAGSLRQAMLDANSAAGSDVINFNITGSGPFTIALATVLPDINGPVTIDGLSQPGAATGNLWAGIGHSLKIKINANGNAYGLRILTAGSGSIIKGLAIGGASGSAITFSFVDNITIETCYLGMDTNGSTLFANSQYGINASGNNLIIGGNIPAKGNLISGNTMSGININQISNSLDIENNFIGTDFSGLVNKGNGVDGIRNATGGNSNTIKNNLISSNAGIGLSLTGSSTTFVGLNVTGNYIGVNRLGAGNLGNGSDGAKLGYFQSSTVDNNIISNNTATGISLNNFSTILFKGNKIGVDINGNTDLGNGSSGVVATSGSGAIFGGINSSDRNIISGNGDAGLSVSGNNNEFYNNYIGTNITGMISIPNVNEGMRLNLSSAANANNTIGGTLVTQRNVISGNGGSGIVIMTNSLHNKIQNNYLGVASDGVSVLPNTLDGITCNSQNNLIGGINTSEINLIANNKSSGIYVGPVNGNSILGNLIFNNTGLGIDLDPTGVNTNDANDADGGSNDGLNYPVINYVMKGSLVVNYNLDVPAGDYRVEVYGNISGSGDPSLHGEGRTYLGYFDITHPGGGSVAFNNTLSGTVAVSPGDLVSLTVTQKTGASTFGSTSEFSKLAKVTELREICSNGIDDDADGLIDNADPDTKGMICNPDTLNCTSLKDTFSVRLNPAVTTYTWSVTPSAPFTAVGDTAIEVNFNKSHSGDYLIRVIAENTCGADTSDFYIYKTKCPEICGDNYDNDEDGFVDPGCIQANPDISQTVVNTPVYGNVGTNDNTDPGSTFTVSTGTGPSHGTIVLNPDGTFKYTPNSGFVGTDSVKYIVCEPAPSILCDTTILVIEVRPLSTAPGVNNTIAQDDHTTTPINTPVTLCIKCNDSDPQGNTQGTPVLIGTIPAGVVLNTDGTITYNPPAGFYGQISFKYKICDNGTPQACDTATVRIDVTPVPASVNQTYANDDANSTIINTPVGGDVSTNDTDPQTTDTFIFSLIGTTTNGGSVVLNTNGSYIYTPPLNYTGTDQFRYRKCDSGTPIACDTATVYLTIFSGCNLNVANVTATAKQPETCGGNEGTITFDKIIPGTGTFEFTYKKDGILTGPLTIAVSDSTYVLGNLTAGVYSEFVFINPSVAGCRDTVPGGSITLTNPAAPTVSAALTSNPATCGGNEGEITLTVTPATGSFTVTFTKNGVPASGIYAASAGSILLSGLTAGTYNDFVVSINNCISAPVIVPVVLTDPAAPSGAVTAPATTACVGSASGTFSISGLTNCTTCGYAWSSMGGVANSPSGATTTFNFTSGGPQTVMVAITNSTTGCSTLLSTNVNVSGIPVISNVVQGTCVGNNATVTVNATVNPSQTIEYSLDGGTYQVSNVFSGVAKGTHSVTAMVQGTTCTSTSFAFSVNCACAAPPTASVTGPLTLCSSGTATLTGTFTNAASGTWEIVSGGGSLSTTTCSVSGCQAVYTPSAAGTATIRFFTNDPDGTGPCIADTAIHIITISATPVIAGSSSANPTMCNTCDGTITLTGITPVGAYTVNYTKDLSPQVYVGTTSAAGDLVLSGLCEGTYDNFTITANNCTSAPLAGTITLTKPASPSGVIAGPSSACLSVATTAYSVGSLANCTSCSYLWSSTAGTAATPSGATTTFTFSTSGSQTVNVTITNNTTGCSQTITYPVFVNGVPSVSNVVQGTCVGNAATMTINASVVPVATLEYSVDGGSYQSSNVFSGLSNGVHTAMVRIAGTTCESPSSYSFEVNCKCASPAMVTLSGPQVICADATATLTANIVNATSGTWAITSGGGSLSASSCAATGCTTVYTPVAGTTQQTIQVTFTSNDPDGTGPCNAGTAVITILVNPVPVIASLSKFNPTSCTACDGSITLSGLSPTTIYNVGYNGPGGIYNGALTTNATGQITISNLCAGAYTDIHVSRESCMSQPGLSTTLVNPAAPGVPVASSNSPVCSGGTLSLTASGVTGAAYTWTGPNGFTSSVQNPTINGAQLSHSGTYCVKQTVDGCSSSEACITVVINPTPAITSALGTNTTTCGGTNGTIVLNGLLPNTTYTVQYISSISGPHTVNLTSTAGGQITITGLSAGIYSSITVSLNGCTSLAAGPVALGDPTGLAAPGITSNSPVCTGNTITLTASGVTGAVFNWTGPNSYTATGQTVNINNASSANAGSYFVTQTVSGCTSPAAVTNVTVNPLTSNKITVATTQMCYGQHVMLKATYDVTALTIAWYQMGITEPIASAVAEVRVTPPAGKTGYILQVTNSYGCIKRDTVYLTTTPCADPDINQTLMNTQVGGNVSSNDDYPSGSVFTLLGTISDGTIVMNTDGTYTYTPSNNFVGTVSVKYRVCMPTAFTSCDTTDLVIEVKPLYTSDANSTIAQNDHTTTPINTPVNLCIKCNDSDPQGNAMWTPALTGPVPPGVVLNSDGTITYTPPTGFTGSISFQYKICDINPISACDLATVTIDVTPVPATENQTYANDDANSTQINNPVSGSVAANDTDPQPADTHVFTMVGGTQNGGTVLFKPDGTYTYTPALNYTGPDQFMYKKCDNGIPVACDTATVYLTITKAINTTIAVVDFNTTSVGVPVSGNVTTNDTDPDGNTQTFGSFLDGSGGTLSSGSSVQGIDDNGVLVANAGTFTYGPGGSYTFTPAAGFTGQVVVPYKICDNGIPQACDITTLTIKVIPNPDMLKNDIIANNDEVVTPYMTPVAGNVIENDSDPNNNPFSVTSAYQDIDCNGVPDGLIPLSSGYGFPIVGTDFGHTVYGTLIFNRDGSYVFTPEPGYSGTVCIVYQICDQGITPQACDLAHLTITVLPDNGRLNDKPFAGDDYSTTPYNTPVTNYWYKNDNEPNEDMVTLNGSGSIQLTAPTGNTLLSTVTTTAGGTVKFYSNGTYTYTPPAGYVGPDKATYTLCDITTVAQNPLCHTATVYLLVTQSPKIGIVKSGYYNDVTEKIEYTYTVYNTGNVPVYDITVTENQLNFTGTGTLPVPVYSSGGSDLGGNAAVKDLAVGQSLVFKAEYVVTQQDFDTGYLNNQAVAKATDPKGGIVTDLSDQSLSDEGHNTPTRTDISTQPKLQLYKTVSSVVDVNTNSMTDEGDQVYYTFKVTNTGNLTIKDISVTDPKVTGITCLKTILGKDESTTCTGNPYTLTLDDINKGYLQNTATVSGVDPFNKNVTDISDAGDDGVETPDGKGITNGDGTDDPTVLMITQQPDIYVVKGSSFNAGTDGIANPGDIITYTYVVTNPGNVTLTSVTLNETVAGFTGTGTLPVPAFVSSTMGSASGTLKPYESATYKATYAITLADINLGQVNNRALTSGTPPFGNPVTDYSDSSNPSDPNETGTSGDPDGNDPTGTKLVQVPGIYSVKSSSLNIGVDGQASAGDIVTYTYKVINSGNVTLTGVTVLELSTSFTGTGTLPVPAFASSTMGSPSGTLIPNETAIYTANYAITQADLDAGKINNSAAVAGTPPSGIAVKDTTDSGNLSDPNETGIPADPAGKDPTGTILPQEPGIKVTKEANKDEYLIAGEIIAYTIKVQNTGNVTLTNVNITDPLVALNTTVASIPPGGIETLVRNYTVKPADITSTSITNMATATGYYNGTTPVTGKDTVTVIYHNLPPEIICPPTNVISAYNQCITNVPNLMAKISDPNGNIVKLTWVMTGATVASSPLTGMNNLYSYEMNAGVTTVTYTVTDSGGLFATCSFTITILDDIVPTIKCPADIVVVPDQGSCTATVQLPKPEATDNCTPAGNLRFSNNAPAVYPVGVTKIWWTVFDAANNKNVCQQNVIVAPCANDDNYTTVKGQPVNGTVTPNDKYPDGSKFTLTGGPSQGTLTFNPDGTFIYNPPAGFTGTVTFTYKICLNIPYENVCDDAVVTIVVEPLAPVANDDQKLNNIKGENVTLNILTNDKLSDESAATAGTVTVDIDPSTPGVQTTRVVPGEGTWTYDPATGNITFDPENNFNGNPTPITYILKDNATGKTDDAKVTVTYSTVAPATMVASVGIVKTSSYNESTGVITYTYTVTNTGEVTVYDVAVNETAAAFTGKGTLPVPVYVSGGAELGGSSAVKDLAKGASMTFSAAYTVVQADKDAGLVTNQALATAKDPYNNTVSDKSDDNSSVKGNDDPTTTLINQKPVIGVVKTSVFNSATGIIEYTYKVTNTGNVTVYDVAVNERISAFTGTGILPVPMYVSGGQFLGGNAAVRDLPVDSTMVFTASYAVTQADKESGGVTNQVLATANSPKGTQVSDKSDESSLLPGNDDPTVTTIPAKSLIGVVKTASFNPSTGEIKYTYKVTNTGEVVVYDIKITETPASFSGTGTLPLPVYESGGSDLGGSVLDKDLAVGASMTFVSIYQVTQADIQKGSISNQALASGKDKKGNPVTDKSDDNSPLAGQDDPTIIKIISAPEIGLVKKASYNSIRKEITYAYVVTNLGKEALLDVSVAETRAMFTGTGILPTPVYSSGGSSIGGNSTIKDLPAGESMTFTSVYKLTQADIDAGAVTNQALASALDPRGNTVLDLSDNTSPAKGNDKPTVVAIPQSPAIGLVKTSVYDPATGKITYTYTVSNTGDVTVYDIAVTETAASFTGKGTLPKPVLVSGLDELGGDPALKDLAVGKSMVFSAVYTLTQADTDAGGVTNQALATGKDPNGKPVSDKSDNVSPVAGNDNPTVTVIPVNPSMTVSKIQDKSSYSKAGEVITYTIVVKNTGNVTLSNLKVNDPLTGLTQDIASLLPGKETTVTTKYTVKQTDVDNGTVVNKAAVTAKDPSGKELTGEGLVTATAVKQPDIKIEKTSDSAGKDAKFGQTITYTIRVTNTGNTTLTNVNVADPLTGLNQTIGTLAPGQVNINTVTYKVKLADETAGKVVNIATVSAIVPGGGVLNGTATVTDKIIFTEIAIPEIFSPNGDGIQDYFMISGIEKYPNAKIEIYNRWGNLVFTQEYYGNTSHWGTNDAWWNGYSNSKWRVGNGKLPAGTYFYILHLNDGSGIRKQGYLFLNSDRL